MPQVREIPTALKPYLFHGLDLDFGSGAEATGDCPWCGREGKFTVNIETGQWRCFVCNEGSEHGKPLKGGNATTFLQLLYEQSDKMTSDYSELARLKRLVFDDSVMFWGCARSAINDHWLVPGFFGGKVKQLYKYAKIPNPKKPRYAFLAVPGFGHQLLGMNLFDKKKPDIYLCEGLWDAVTLWEVLRNTKRLDDGTLARTASEASSLYARANVISVASAYAFDPVWTSIFSGKRVYLMCQNDHPHDNNGQVSPPASLTGMQRIAEALGKSESPPEEIHFLRWGPAGYDLDLKSGYDLRDFLSGDKEPLPLDRRIEMLEGLLKKIEVIPDDWIGGRSLSARRQGRVDVEMLDCSDWKTLVNQWKKAMAWTKGLDKALAASLAVILSTEQAGDQLWLRMIGPPSCGKTTLCEAFAVNRRFVYSKDTLTGLVSGFQIDREGSENMSMVERIKNKTLCINDGDTILQLPNRDQVLSQLRAFYSRNIRAQYGNKMSKDFEGYNATVILCGTESLRILDGGELGERFVDAVIVDHINDEEEADIALRKAYKAAREILLTSNGKIESRDDPDMVKAKQLTGGYIDYLRSNPGEKLAAIDIERNPEAMILCRDLATFVAYARARPSKRQEEKSQREMSYRLTSQMVRLAQCLAVVLNKDYLDQEIMDRVRAIALDTARGRTLEIIKYLYAAGEPGMSLYSLCIRTGENEDKERTLLTFLKRIGAVELRERKKIKGLALAEKPRWGLTERMQQLYDRVIR